MQPTIRLSRAFVGEEEISALARVIKAGYLGMASEVKAFEEELAAFIGNDRQVVCVNTGTSALHLAVQACGIGPGDEVLVPTLTFVATFQAVSATGATPVACDIDLSSGCTDVDDAKKRITNKTKAIIPVHFAGGFGNLAGIYDLAKQHGLRVIEDAAHSFGGLYQGKIVGSQGDIICFSFDSIKNVTCGDGGAIVTADAKIADYVRDARLLSVEKDTEKRFSGKRSWDFDVKEQGWRYHMSDIMAAIGRTQLKRLPEMTKKRRTLAGYYCELLEPYKAIRHLDIDYSQALTYIFPIVLEKGERDSLREFLLQNNIETGLHYKPNHLLTRYQTGYPLPKAEEIYQKMLTLPLHLHMNKEDVKRVCEVIGQWLKEKQEEAA